MPRRGGGFRKDWATRNDKHLLPSAWPTLEQVALYIAEPIPSRVGMLWDGNVRGGDGRSVWESRGDFVQKRGLAKRLDHLVVSDDPRADEKRLVREGDRRAAKRLADEQVAQARADNEQAWKDFNRTQARQNAKWNDRVARPWSRGAVGIFKAYFRMRMLLKRQSAEMTH